MITADQIRAMVHQLILSKISLDEFEEWLTANSWNAHQDSEVEAMQLVGKIELALAEAGTDQESYAALLKVLGGMVGTFEMGTPPAPRLVASSTVKLIPFSFQFELLADVDKRYGMGFSYTPLLPA